MCVYTNAPGVPIPSGEQAIADAARTALAELGHL
jgi:hypothetical protein